MIKAITGLFDKNAKELSRMAQEVARIYELEPVMRKRSDAELGALTREFRIRLARGETLDQALPEVFAAVREAAKRTVGERHYDVQLIGGITLHEGRIAEMKTGEGKTLSSTAAIYLNALDFNPLWLRWAEVKWGENPEKWIFEHLWPAEGASPDSDGAPAPLTESELATDGAGGLRIAARSVPVSKGVHIVTVNDYLARRDKEWMGSIYEFLGLRVGVIQNGMEYSERREQYWCDITYGTNNEFGFDYLRDNMVRAREQMVQRGHNFAIVDEVDSILIDEARTPLIISGAVQISRHKYRELKPRVETMVRHQQKIVNRLLDQAEQMIVNQGDEHQIAENLAHVLRADPKNLRLLKIFEEPYWNKLTLQTIQFHKSKSGANDIHLFDEEMYYIIDEQSNTAAIQTKGEDVVSRGDASFFTSQDIEEQILEIESDESIPYEEKFERVERLRAEAEENEVKKHNIHQLVKAYALFHKDVEYVIKDGKIMIVDEFTGRLMPGRRFSDGLHEALEAKENVKIERESQTMATITLQNYFRLYDKLAGMTGTAKTEEDEFIKIYGMDVVVIPTNRPLIRNDYNDAIFKTERAKFNAVVEEIRDCYRRGQPVLVGTVSVEKSEQFANELRKRKVPHNVLNAKNHEREAEIVAEAGRLGKVTIATNMAGRGTDIKLGGFARRELLEHWQRNDMAPGDMKVDDPPEEAADRLAELWAEEYLTEDELKKARTPEEKRELLLRTWKFLGMNPLPFGLVTRVQELGGFHILGTERHESRRIDNQLRGRAGRQGDPGSSRFYISLEDDLMRRFGSEKIIGIMNRLGVKEEEVIEHPVISRSIERAQTKVEARNFEIRKHVLDYDDVMNVQRDHFYKLRTAILEGLDVRQTVVEYIDGAVADVVDKNCPPELEQEDWNLDELLFEFKRILFLPELTLHKIQGKKADEIKEYLAGLCRQEYERREERYGAELMRELERAVLLRCYDRNWVEHLLEMDGLKEGIGLRAYGNIDPLVAYKKEAMDMFFGLMSRIKQDVVRLIFRVELTRRAPETQEDPYKDAKAAGSGEGGSGTVRRKGEKVGRNARCPCGSGKKFKHCCGH